MATTAVAGRKRQSSVSSQPLYRFEAQLEFNPIGLVPEGLRMANPFEGTVTGGELAAGPFAGARVWGIDHLLLRSDGVAVIDAEKTISAGDLHLYEHVRGYSIPPADMDPPPLEVVLAPGFEWPDVLFPIHGFSQFRAALPDLAYLNRALATIEGWASFATGDLAIETRLVEPSGAVAGPGQAS
jgi:hypothetical protein